LILLTELELHTPNKGALRQTWFPGVCVRLSAYEMKDNYNHK